MSDNIVNRLVASVQVVKKNQHVVTSRGLVGGRAAVHVRQVVRPAKQIQRQPVAQQSNILARQLIPKKAIQSIAVSVVPKARAPLRQEQRTPPRRGGPRFITPDVSVDALEYIKNLRGCGRERILVIIGNGPSVNEVDLSLLNNHRKIDFMSVNRPDMRVWPTRYWLFCDLSQLRHNQKIWDDYRGVIINSTAITKRKANSVQVKNRGGFGFSKDLMHGFHIGRSSVYAAMQAALWLDYHQIYIVGCDMSEVGGKMHFYGVNPDVDPKTRAGRFKIEAEYYDYAGKHLEEVERRRFVFCSSYLKWPFIEKFGHIDHLAAVATILAKAETL